MNTNLSVEYKNWIEKLSEENFNELVLNYAKEYYGSKDVYISNCPYDGCRDLIVNKNGKTLKRNIQITIQKKGFEQKLYEDCRKSYENVVKYNYKNKLDFYTSISITPAKKNELIRNAEIDYNIELKIIDSNELGGLAVEYKSIRQTIYKINKTCFPDEELKIDKKTKILFDTLSISKDITEIKNNFVKSLIISYLFEVNEATVEEIYNGLCSTFYEKYEKSFFQNEIGKLKQENKILDIPDSKPKRFTLTKEILSTLEQIDQNAQIHEKNLLDEFRLVLNRYNIEQDSELIVKYIIDLYNANYEIDESEILKEANNHSKKIQKIFSELISRLQKTHNLDYEVSNNIARQLLVICNKNEFLNKTSISKMFTNLFKINKLDDYLSTSKRKVYLDTQILLQLFCYHYENIETEDKLYNAVKLLLESIENSTIPVNLFTTIEYLEEVAWHIYNGLRLERFLSLDYIKDLGPSKNIFFNFYLELANNYSIQFESFSEFIEELFDIDSNFSNEKFFIDELIKNLKERLEMLDITVETPPLFDDYEKYRKEYEVVLSYIPHDQKTYDARKHDLNTILYLSEMHFDNDEGYFTEPYLITWDSTFYEARKIFSKKFRELNNWFLYPPLKFANTISVMNLQIDSKAINYNIISLVEENFNLSNESISFLDLVNSLFSSSDAGKLKLVNKLAKLRKKSLSDTDINDFGRIKHKNLPIDEFLLLIQKFYKSTQSKKSYNELVSLFENNTFADEISLLIEKNIFDFQKNSELKPLIIKDIDNLIEKNNEAQQGV